MAIIGWVVLVIIAGFASIFCIFACLNNFGQYGIGGKPNSALAQILTIGAVVGIGLLWVKVFEWAPFAYTG